MTSKLKQSSFAAAVVVAAALFASAADIGTQALAADLGPSYKAPPVVAPVPYTWAGFYAGGSLGYSWNRLTVNDLDYFDGLGDNSQDNNGFIGGGEIGYNWQNRGLVVGIEADMSYLSNSSVSNNDDSEPPPYAQISSKIDALGTVRGRLGIAVDPALLYVTGGLAFGDVRNQYADLHDTPNVFFNDSGWRPGWVFGSGLAAKWDANWSWKVEALYYQLSDNTVTTFNPSDGRFFRQRFGDEGLIARVGLDYAFR